LPPRDDRALPRPARGGAALVPPGAGAEPALLAPLGAGGAAVLAMRRVVVALALIAAVAAPAAASAHPLGNFTVNRFSRVEAAAGHVYVVYVLDLAEIPTYQAGRIDARAYARRIAHGVRLEVDGR